MSVGTGGSVVTSDGGNDHSLTDPFHLLDYEYLKRRTRLLCCLFIVGFGCLVALTVFVRSAGVPSLEAHLRDDVTESIANDVNGLRVFVNGQEVLVSGTVATQGDRERIVERVRTRWGVRGIDASLLVVKVVK
jgi:hypothetical protein